MTATNWLRKAVLVTMITTMTGASLWLLVMQNASPF